MSLRIHHLNCGTLCPSCERLLNGGRSWTRPGTLVCHCLLIETAKSLVLVDTGLGSKDIAEPRRRLGPFFPALMRPRLSTEETAVAQVRALGFDPRDVRDIIATHLDLDHVGGLADFPEARVHVFKPELGPATDPSLRDSARYRPVQFDHQPRWVAHEEGGERWYGFDSMRTLPDLDEDILLIPLTGHTRGHTGVAVRNGDRWLLHCGDAYFHRSQVSEHPRVPAGLALLEAAVQTDRGQRLRNQRRLRELALTRAADVDLFCAHDPVEWARYQQLNGEESR